MSSWDRIIFRDEDVQSYPAPGFGFTEEVGIGLGCKSHVACLVCCSIAGVCCHIIKEFVNLCECVSVGAACCTPMALIVGSSLLSTARV